MNAFGASVVLLLSALDARRESIQGTRRECESVSRCGGDVPCAGHSREWIEGRRVSGHYRICRACFRD
jgi:hypothetical protein